MKSKTSCFNKTIFKKNITHYWPIWAVILAWNLFVMPFMIYNNSLQYRMAQNLTEKELAQCRLSDLLSVSQVYSAPAIIFIFSVITAMAVFSYLYNSRSANAMHAFPVSRKELFVTNYISGLLFLIVPQAAGFLTGTLVGALCGYTGVNVLLSGFGLACGVSFTFYNLTVFIAMFTGQILAIPVFAVILNFLYVGMKALLSLLAATISYGISPSFSAGRFSFLSPLYYLSTHIYIVYSDELSVPDRLAGGMDVAVFSLVSIVFLAAAYLIYRVRDVETAGSLISVPWISPLFRWGAAFCGGTMFGLLFCSIIGTRSSTAVFLSLLVFSLLFGAVFFFGAQMFLEKGFRVFRKKRVMECCVFTGALAVLLLCVECDLFGQEKRMPDISEIKEAYINEYSVIGGDDAETIGQILDIHGQMISSKKEVEKMLASDMMTDYISVRYYLKDGSSLTRHYEIPYAADALEDSSSIISKLAAMAVLPENYAKEVFGGSLDNLISKEGSIDLYDEDGEVTGHRFTEKEAGVIYDAILADIKEGNFKEHVLRRYLYGEDLEKYGSSYANMINLDYTGKEDIFSGYTVYNGGFNTAELGKTGYATIAFDKNCRHIIDALVETGIIESEKDLTLEETYSEKD